MPLEELRKLQGERLAKNFRHVYENVEYYRKRCQEAGVTPDDIKKLKYTVLRHRISLNYTALADNVTVEQIIDSIMGAIKTP